MAMQRVKDAAEKAKKDLSGMMQTQIPCHSSAPVHRARFISK